MLGRQRLNSLLPRPTRILLDVPLGRRDLGEERLHPRLITREQLPVEIARVPVDQHSAEIEHDRRRVTIVEQHVGILAHRMMRAAVAMP